MISVRTIGRCLEIPKVGTIMFLSKQGDFRRFQSMFLLCKTSSQNFFALYLAVYNSWRCLSLYPLWLDLHCIFKVLVLKLKPGVFKLKNIDNTD